MTMVDVIQSVSMLTKTASVVKPAAARLSRRFLLFGLLICIICFALGQISAAALYTMYPPEMMLGSVVTGIVITGTVIAGTLVALVVISVKKF
ncbi:MAG TPA: hypothetical protein VMG59_05940 [Phycisphaerae bacterium]|nr:hypothetical protein [Phycisphaerae bacterium]